MSAESFSVYWWTRSGVAVIHRFRSLGDAADFARVEKWPPQHGVLVVPASCSSSVVREQTGLAIRQASGEQAAAAFLRASCALPERAA